MNAEQRRLKTRQVVRDPGNSPAALTDCFTSSNLLLIRSVISDQCGRRHGERGILAQCRLAFTGSERITRHSENGGFRRCRGSLPRYGDPGNLASSDGGEAARPRSNRRKSARSRREASGGSRAAAADCDGSSISAGSVIFDPIFHPHIQRFGKIPVYRYFVFRATILSW